MMLCRSTEEYESAATAIQQGRKEGVSVCASNILAHLASTLQRLRRHHRRALCDFTLKSRIRVAFGPADGPRSSLCPRMRANAFHQVFVKRRCNSAMVSGPKETENGTDFREKDGKEMRDRPPEKFAALQRDREEGDVRFSQTLSALPRNSGPGVFTSILAKLARERRWWDVDAVFAEMSARSIRPNRIHLNAAINVFAKARRPQKAEEWLIWMQDNDVKPNEVSYNSVINACAQTGYVERAEMWLGRMLEAGIQANEEVWLERMLAAGVKTDAFSYNSVINACAQRRDIERAETWLEKMLSEGIQADEVRACLAAGDRERLERWRKLMRLEEPSVGRTPLQKPSRPSACTTRNLDEVDKDILSDTLPKKPDDLARRRRTERRREDGGAPLSRKSSSRNATSSQVSNTDRSQTWMWARMFMILVLLQLVLAVVTSAEHSQSLELCHRSGLTTQSSLRSLRSCLSELVAIDAYAQKFEERLQKIRNDRGEQVPFSYLKQAHLAYLPERPVKIACIQVICMVEFCCELPSIPRSADSVITSLQAGRLLGGCDTAIAIQPPPPAGTTRTGLSSVQYFGAKWDLQEYYDEVHKLALQTVDGKVPPSEKGRPWGIFAGLSGQQQDWHYMTGEAKINKLLPQHTWANSSAAALVSRCSYGLNFSGPAIAVDTGDSSGLIACESTAGGHLPYGLCKFSQLDLGVFDEASDGYTKGEGANQPTQPASRESSSRRSVLPSVPPSLHPSVRPSVHPSIHPIISAIIALVFILTTLIIIAITVES
ncbi:Pentatricopeptide repeat-containing protein [Symbiodinium microadriaticum]|uniref:Pentatricopeptide repeat-containing protein n=1 Tax=Symbiodinium microadriaticum TaxID=2951 RepID=A0A1Q9CMA6_SYMMI|nr:Pentatricopeptide repeat-containing protein [Symbiodinium microadriaticum]